MEVKGLKDSCHSTCDIQVGEGGRGYTMEFLLHHQLDSAIRSLSTGTMQLHMYMYVRAGSTVKDLATVDILENSGSKLGLGRCDRLGRLWCAITGPHYQPTEGIDSNGALYSYAAGQSRQGINTYHIGLVLCVRVDADCNPLPKIYHIR